MVAAAAARSHDNVADFQFADINAAGADTVAEAFLFQMTDEAPAFDGVETFAVVFGQDVVEIAADVGVYQGAVDGGDAVVVASGKTAVGINDIEKVVFDVFCFLSILGRFFQRFKVL